MAERHDAFDVAVQAILDGAAEVAIPRDLEPLVAIAADLRDLPDPEFKQRLGGRMTTMTSVSVHDVMPYLVPHGAPKMVEFLENALGGEVLEKYEHEGAIVHAKVRVGASVVEM